MSDSSAPLMGMRVAEDGTITYDFDGTVHAQGLTMEERVSSDPHNTIEWLQDGVQREGIFGSRLTDKSKVRQLILFAGNLESAEGPATLELTGTDAESLGSAPSIIARAGFAGAALLIDYLGRSSFLQLAPKGPPVPERRLVNFDSTTVKWPGGSPQSEVKKIAHGLGVQPLAVFAIESAFNVPAACYCGEKGEANFSVLVRTIDGSVPAAGFTASIDWIAIG